METADSVSVKNDAPSDVGVVGQYDPTTGTATENSVYAIRRVADALTQFGDIDNSPLTRTVVDALREGASPVYALTPTRNTVAAEDIVGNGDSGILANDGVTEDATKVEFTVDGTVKTTVKTYHPPEAANVTAGEAHYNPTTGEYALDEVPATTATVDYEYFDYSGGIDRFIADVDATSAVDRLGCTTENETIVTYLLAQVESVASQQDRMIAVAGAGAHVHPDTYVNPHNSSRLQLVYPIREPDNHETVLGSVLGTYARLGIDASPLNKRLSQYRVLSDRISDADVESLDAENVVPIVSESAGARFRGDATCVDSANTAEAGMSYGFARLVMDYIADSIEAVEEPYVGRFNNPRVRGDLENALKGRLDKVLASEVILTYNLSVYGIDSQSAGVDVSVDVVAPLANIFNTLTAGN